MFWTLSFVLLIYRFIIPSLSVKLLVSFEIERPIHGLWDPIQGPQACGWHALTPNCLQPNYCVIVVHMLSFVLVFLSLSSICSCQILRLVFLMLILPDYILFSWCKGSYFPNYIWVVYYYNINIQLTFAIFCGSLYFLWSPLLQYFLVNFIIFFIFV